MALSFPNPARNYDTKHRCVRFWGYDGTFEVSFMVEQRVLSQINPGAAQDESGVLRVFDKYRDRIIAVARRVYRGVIQKLTRLSRLISDLAECLARSSA